MKPYILTNSRNLLPYNLQQFFKISTRFQVQHVYQSNLQLVSTFKVCENITNANETEFTHIIYGCPLIFFAGITVFLIFCSPIIFATAADLLILSCIPCERFSVLLDRPFLLIFVFFSSNHNFISSLPTFLLHHNISTLQSFIAFIIIISQSRLKFN